jgi:putative ABC transport system ATP-binding protein
MAYNQWPGNTAGTFPVISVRKLSKEYYMGRTTVPALVSVDLDVYPGEFVAVMGPSGSGKSSFMNILGCLDRPTGGEYYLDGEDVSEMSVGEQADIRNEKIGFIFQSFHLLPWMTAQENVELPMIYAGVAAEQRQERAYWALSMLGLTSRADHKPLELSGGQQQRVAIARALVTSPAIILADEPTGNLDSRTSAQIMSILQRLNARGITIVLVTHEPDIANYCKRKVVFRDGRLIHDAINPAPAIAQEELQKQPAPEERKIAL